MNAIPAAWQTVLLLRNRSGFGAGIALAHLKLTQEVIAAALFETFAPFAPFASFAMRCLGQAFRLDVIRAGRCRLGAVSFVFRR